MTREEMIRRIRMKTSELNRVVNSAADHAHVVPTKDLVDYEAAISELLTAASCIKQQVDQNLN